MGTSPEESLIIMCVYLEKNKTKKKKPEYANLPDWIGIWPSNQKRRDGVVISGILIHR